MSETEERKKTFFEKTGPFLLILTILLAFTLGYLINNQSIKLPFSFGTNQKEKATNIPTATPYDSLGGLLSQEKLSNIPEVGEDDHIFGSKEAEAYIIVYDDFECPYCKTFHITLKQAVEDYKDKVSIVYRQFPLDMLHSKARTEAEATECVAKLAGEEAFWDFVNQLFATTPSNNGFNLDLLPGMVVKAGVDAEEFNACLRNRDTKEIVEKQEEGGNKAGVTGTPGVFLLSSKGQGWALPGAVPQKLLYQYLDKALE